MSAHLKTYLRMEISFLTIVFRNNFYLRITIILIFFMSQQPLTGKDLLSIEVSR